MKIQNHLLIDDRVEIGDSPNRGGIIRPRVIVLHYTASGGEDGSGDAAYLSRATSRASAHLVVGRNGSLDQIIPFNRKAWHAGRSKYEGKSNVNSFSIGIEIDNWGWLDHGGKSHTGTVVPEEHIFEGERSGHKYWEKYRPLQLDTVEEAISAICAAYPIEDIVGHEDISPGRKQDPGPALDEFMKSMKEKYLSNEPKKAAPKKKKATPKAGTKKVTADGLRLRARPNYASIIKTHLYKDNVVQELKRNVFPGWSYIKFGNRTGYVANRYLT